MFRIFLLFGFFFGLQLGAGAQKIEWLQKIDGDRCETTTDLVFTPDEDILLTGIYEDPAGVRFQSRNAQNLTIAPDQDSFPESHSTIFLARYSPDGNLKWAVNAFGENSIHPWDLHCDREGNSLVAGNFRGKAIFNSANGKSKTLQAIRHEQERHNDPYNYFLAKYDAYGNLLWVKVGLSRENSVAFEVKTDDRNNVYVRGYSTGNSISFDKHTLLPRSEPGGYAQSFSLIVVKYSPAGNEEWITYAGDVSATGLEVDGQGNISLPAGLTKQAKLFSSNGKTWAIAYGQTGDADRQLLQLNSKGELVKASPYFASVPDAQFHKTVRDAAGNYFALVGAKPNYSMGQQYKLTWLGKTYTTRLADIFLAKLDAHQNPLWITQLKGKNADTPLDITLDNVGNPIISGTHGGHLAVTDITSDSVVLSSTFRTMFLASFTTNGLLNWATNAGSLLNGFDEHLHLAVNSKNQLYFTGQINVPSEIGKQKIDVRGEKGWQSPGWQTRLDYNKYSDAFFASVNLEEKLQPDVILNLSLNYKEAAAILAKSLAVLERAIDYITPEADINEAVTFTYQSTPGTETTNGANLPNVLVYPNPVSASLASVTVQLTLAKPSEITFSLLNQNNQPVSTRQENYPAGQVQFLQPVTGLQAGLYFLVVQLNGQQVVKRIVVQ